MIKKICLIISCFFSFYCYAEENISLPNKFDLIENPQALLTASNRYIDFINRISKGEAFPQMEIAATLLSPNCKKILNGQLLTQNSQDFVADLLSVYENHGAWKIYPQDIIAASPENIVVLRLIIEIEKFGTHTAIVILRYNSSYLITEINEVLSKVKNSYDFEENK